MQAELDTEQDRILLNRYREALEANLHPCEADLFSRTDIDVGWLRKLVAGNCPPELICRILF